MEKVSNSKRLARNSFAMYFRMGFLTIISLYTSRVILQKLGVEDYGIYNLVGSIVLMFNSLKSIFAGSTQRFLNYEMGSGTPGKLNLVFNLSVLVNILISVLLIVAVEIVGIWFLEYKINVEVSRLVAAKWVFQLSVISMVVGILTNPFNACIIAHEKLDFYAFISIIEGLLKLGICYILSVFYFDRLILYGILILLIQIFVFFASFIYSRRNFEECRFALLWDKAYFKKMTVFAGWAFFGNTSYALTQNGLNMILNVFGGPIVNAARGIAYQVSTAIHGFVTNLVIVLKPFVVKTYASGQIDKSMKMVNLSTKILFYVQLVVVICFTYLTAPIIRLWLGDIPDYSVEFVNLVLIHMLIKSLHNPLDMMYSAEGDLKCYQIIEGVVLALPIPFSYLALVMGMPYSSVFMIVIMCEIFHIAAIAYLASFIWRLPLGTYLRKAILPCALCFAVYMVLYAVNNQFADNICMVLANIMLTIIISSIVMIFVGLTGEEKKILLSVIK